MRRDLTQKPPAYDQSLYSARVASMRSLSTWDAAVSVIQVDGFLNRCVSVVQSGETWNTLPLMKYPKENIITTDIVRGESSCPCSVPPFRSFPVQSLA